MGCFLRCFGGDKDRRRCKRSASPQILSERVENVHRESISIAEKTITETPSNSLISELRNEAMEDEKLSPSRRKIVTFNPSITTFEHFLVKESIDSLPDCNGDVVGENQEELKSIIPLCSLSEDDASVITSVRLYPPNHRYHNAIGSDEEYGDSDLDDFDEWNDEEDYDEHLDNESVLTASMESITQDSKDRSDHVSSVLNPIENVIQWKDAESHCTYSLSPHYKKLTADYVEAPRVSSSLKLKSTHVQNENQETAMDASLSNWLVSPEIMLEKNTVSQ